ncbi:MULTISPECIES: GNAT family N-acetyltransferase [Nocardiaceae]|uniref:GNAT family protein n=1 Tax=Rhodococcoides yunnanense TaxID=278209 RepID=A0ABU4BFK2_9NOCA|nr:MULTISPECIES: GNAT family protein [Rhodococcus]MDI9894977.1 GNAT family protein [Rhodococcus sp. IEGM 1381]MDV6262977.1 GNAT family protein [Rhodococcus yunnanensis]
MPRTWSSHPGWPAKLGPVRVAGGTVTLRPVRVRDAAAWSRIRTEDRAHLEPWEPSGEGSWNSRHHISSWPTLCSGLKSEARKGHMLPMVIEVDGEFCGQITTGNIVRGALRSAWIGYWVSKEVNGKGVATAALALGLDHCFGPVGLHRVEATVRPENLASQAVLRNVGFREEGLLYKYLDVDGEWRDHKLVAITSGEVQGTVVDRLVRSGRAAWA